MELSIKKSSEIGLILFNLLHQNYDCTMKCMKTLQNEEMNDAIKYNIERYKNKHTKFSTYSFLYILQGSRYLNGIIKRKKNRIINRPAYSSPNNTWRRRTGGPSLAYDMTYDDLIDKYDEILDIPNISDEQRTIILKMKSNRINKHLKLVE